MKKYIYYPNFEPPDTNWLKFAILYLDRVESIVPYSRRNLLTDDYKRILGETDLIELISPDDIQRESATKKAIEEAEKIISKPHFYSTKLFNKPNLKRMWQDESTWSYQIYGEKISYDWEQFCEDEGIGRRNPFGIILPQRLAFIYMTHLAKEIAFSRNGNIITDNVDYNLYTSQSRIRTIETNQRDKFMRGVIQLNIPKNIEEIELKKLIDFRNKNRANIAAFNSQINNVESSICNGITETGFVEQFNSIYSELIKECVLLGAGAAAIPFTFYTLIKNPLALDSEYYENVIGGLSLLTGGYFSVKKALYDVNEERLCKKYFARLKKL